MPRVAERLLDVPLCFRVEEGRVRTEGLPVRVDRSREGLGEPPQGHRVEDLFGGRCFVGPLDELLSDPGVVLAHSIV